MAIGRFLRRGGSRAPLASEERASSIGRGVLAPVSVPHRLGSCCAWNIVLKDTPPLSRHARQRQRPPRAAPRDAIQLSAQVCGACPGPVGGRMHEPRARATARAMMATARANSSPPAVASAPCFDRIAPPRGATMQCHGPQVCCRGMHVDGAGDSFVCKLQTVRCWRRRHRASRNAHPLAFSNPGD